MYTGTRTYNLRNICLSHRLIHSISSPSSSIVSHCTGCKHFVKPFCRLLQLEFVFYEALNPTPSCQHEKTPTSSGSLDNKRLIFVLKKCSKREVATSPIFALRRRKSKTKLRYRFFSWIHYANQFLLHHKYVDLLNLRWEEVDVIGNTHDICVALVADRELCERTVSINRDARRKKSEGGLLCLLPT